MNIRDLISNALSELDIPLTSIELEVPREEAHGDLSTPVAMTLSRKLKKAPRKIAEDLVGVLRSNIMFEKVVIAGPGFINFFFSREYLIEQLHLFLSEPQRFTRINIGGGEKVQIEYVSANPTGPLHLGHGRGAVVGSALSSLLKMAGYEVQREFYVNDAGRQVRLLGESVFARYLALCGKRYEFPEDGYRGGYVNTIAEEIYGSERKKYCETEFTDCADYFAVYACKKMLDELKHDLEEFGVGFDTFQSERELFSQGHVSKLIGLLRQKGFVYEKGGAVWFKSTEFGDDKDRVIIKSDGQYTYFASDIAYHFLKVNKGFSSLINIWGADHHGYVQRIRSALGAAGFDPNHLTVILVQMVSLLRGGKPVQMSKRAGEFVTLREVMEEIGTDTTRFIFLTRRPDSHLDFDLEVAKKHSAENPVFYVQYAFARINSIFRKATEEGYKYDELDHGPVSMLDREEEVRLVKKILYYPMVFEGAVNAKEPHRITYYLQELAGLFHPYYNRYRVLNEDRDLSMARLCLCKAIMLVLNEGLLILGISAPEKM